ncbi:MAG: ATPase inhibitor subunit zeta, partial [Pseudomonadota bacterium]
SVIRSDFEEPGDEDVYRKVKGDFDEAGVDQSEHQIRRTMSELMAEAVKQIEAS